VRAVVVGVASVRFAFISWVHTAVGVDGANGAVVLEVVCAVWAVLLQA
jgi:hypothetical protein